MENTGKHWENGRQLLLWYQKMQYYTNKRPKFYLKLEIHGMLWRQPLVRLSSCSILFSFSR